MIEAAPRPITLSVVEEALGHRAADADACITCGACLPVCPTYAATGLERESPRGRVQLVRAAAAGQLAADDYFLRQMYDCLDCRACETACPVGVPIGSLVLEARSAAQHPGNPARRPEGRVVRWARNALTRHLFGHPRRMELPLVLARWLYQRTGLQRVVRATGLLRVVPILWRLEQWLPQLPDRPWRWRYADGGQRLAPAGEVRLRAAFFLGCFMNAIFADASAATVDVLRRNGVEILTPLRLQCCGAPQTDMGDFASARAFARVNVAALEETGADIVFADCAACSGMLKEYGELLAGDPEWAARARAISSKTRDFSELMRDLIPVGPPLGRIANSVTFHEPCHLGHAQKVTDAPRDVLAMIPGVRFVDMPEANVCCGSAGTFTFRRWEQSIVMLDAKIDNASQTGTDVVVTANPGCLGQIEMGLRRAGSKQRLRHLSQVLQEAYIAGEHDPGTP